MCDLMLFVGCTILSLASEGAKVKGNNATITFSAEHIPVNDEIKFVCKLDRNMFESCK